MKPNVRAEFVAVLNCLQRTIDERLAGYSSGRRRVIQNGRDITEEAMATTRAEKMQIERMLSRLRSRASRVSPPAIETDGEV